MSKDKRSTKRGQYANLDAMFRGKVKSPEQERLILESCREHMHVAKELSKEVKFRTKITFLAIDKILRSRLT